MATPTPPETPEEDNAREAANRRARARAWLVGQLRRLDPSAAETKLRAAAGALEEAAVAAALLRVRDQPWRDRNALCSAAVLSAGHALCRPSGPFPDDLLGLEFLAGAAPAGAVVAAGGTPAAELDPRETIRRLLIRTLCAAAPELAGDRSRTLDLAAAIERAAFNEAIRLAKASEEPPRRAWNCTAFVDLYSCRCGAVVSLLDPLSSTCQAYGSQVVPRLLSGELTAFELGTRQVLELIPDAVATERVEIARRSAQKVAEKHSELFACPHCKARRCVYQTVQRRALDEAADYLCKCLSCGHNFVGKS